MRKFYVVDGSQLFRSMLKNAAAMPAFALVAGVILGLPPKVIDLILFAVFGAVLVTAGDHKKWLKEDARGDCVNRDSVAGADTTRTGE